MTNKKVDFEEKCPSCEIGTVIITRTIGPREKWIRHEISKCTHCKKQWYFKELRDELEKVKISIKSKLRKAEAGSF